MRATSKILSFFVAAFVGISSAASAQEHCSVDDFLKQLAAGQVQNSLEVSDCPEDKDEELVAAVLSELMKAPQRSDADDLIRVIQSSYRGLNNPSRFNTVATRLQNELDGTPLAFAPDAGNRHLLNPLIAKLLDLQKQAALVSPAVREYVAQSLSTIESRISNMEASVAEEAQPFQTIQGRIAQLESSSNATKASVSFTKNALMVSSFFTLVTLGLLVYLILQNFQLSKRVDDAEAATNDVARDRGEFETRLTQLENSSKKTPPAVEELIGWRTTLTDELAALQKRIEEIGMRVPVSPPSTDPAGQGEVSTAIDNIKGNIEQLSLAVRQLLPLRDHLTKPSRIALLLELNILKEAWNKFSDNKEVAATLDRIQTMGWEEIREPLLSQLPPAIPEELRPTFDTVVAPARDFHNLVAKLGLIQRLLNNELPPLPNDHQALMRVREFANLLTMIQNSNLVADRLNFQLERWVEDQFLSFADLYLQKYQKAVLEQDGARLEPGLQIVRRILKVADLEPVDVALGVTAFDSTRHIGRSTTSDSNFANNLILGVVRNGFVRGGQILRQPEVIVNRVG